MTSMEPQSRIFASAMFVLIAIILIAYTWVPTRSGLKHESGKITQVIPKTGTWYEVEIITSSGIRLSCKTKRESYSSGSRQCPLELLEPNQGQTVDILYKKTTPYQLTLRKKLLIDYSAFKETQRIGILSAVLMLFMTAGVWKMK